HHAVWLAGRGTRGKPDLQPGQYPSSCSGRSVLRRVALLRPPFVLRHAHQGRGIKEAVSQQPLATENIGAPHAAPLLFGMVRSESILGICADYCRSLETPAPDPPHGDVWSGSHRLPNENPWSAPGRVLR